MEISGRDSRIKCRVYGIHQHTEYEIYNGTTNDKMKRFPSEPDLCEYEANGNVRVSMDEQNEVLIHLVPCYPLWILECVCPCVCF